MSYKFKNKKVNLIINVTYSLIVLALIYIAFRYAFKLLLPFIASLTISIIIEPFVIAFIRKFNIKRTISAFICVITFYLVVFAFTALVCAFTMDGISKLAATAPEYISEIETSFKKIYQQFIMANPSQLSKIINQLISQIKLADISELLIGNFGSRLINPISDFIKSLPTVLLSFIVTLVSTFFISSTMPDIKNFFLSQFTQSKRYLIIQSKRTIISTIKKIIKSYFIIMSITFIELAVLFYIFKIKPTIPLALIITAVDILPILGVGTILIPWAAISLIIGDLSKALVLLSIYILITVIRQIIEPKIIGSSIGLSPLLTLISIYIGFKLFGILGVIVTPIAVILIIEIHKTGAIKIWKDTTAIDKIQSEEYNNS